VSFVTEGTSHAIGFVENGQDAVNLVNCLNGGQSVSVTESGGRLAVVPDQSDAEVLKQLAAEDAPEGPK
jgi:hypothetical protein